MKLLQRDANGLVFELGRREKLFFVETLKNFPLVPVAHHTITKNPASGVENDHQVLLAEAMASHKAELKGRVGALVGDRQRFVLRGAVYRVAFTREELEWLLQVLNDVRVGSWLLLGCPDPVDGRKPEVTEASARLVMLMELSGHFEFELIEALGSGR